MTLAEATIVNTAPRLSMRGVSKSYGPVRALDGADFDVRPGEVMALLGENGAGKSTLVKVLAGLVSPDAGTILIDGEEHILKSSRKSQSSGIAVVQQEYSSVPNLSVAENVFLGSLEFGRLTTGRGLARRAKPLLAAVGLSYVDPRSPLGRLSVAERQLVEIARVLARKANILLFDEPTAALADKEIARVLAAVRRLADEGHSVIYVTHRLAEVFTIADRVTVFRDGRSLPPVAIKDLDVDSVVTMMLGRKLGSLFPDHGPSTSETILELTDLRHEGLNEPLDLSVGAGQILGLIGQMGSGAATTVEALAGTIPTQSGRLRVSDVDVALGDRAEGIRQGVAYCSADRKKDGIFPGLSIRQNISAPWLSDISRWGVLNRKRERRLARTASESFAIDVERLDSAVGNLSGGNQQKVALGRWIGGPLKVLLVEEPTRGVDVGARAEIYQRLRDLCGQGASIVVSSSDTAEILGLCDVIATFYRGRMVEMKAHGAWDHEQLTRQIMHGTASTETTS